MTNLNYDNWGSTNYHEKFNIVLNIKITSSHQELQMELGALKEAVQLSAEEMGTPQIVTNT